MSDRDVIDELQRVVDAQDFGAVDVPNAIRQANRTRRVRFASAAGAGLAVAGLAVAVAIAAGNGGAVSNGSPDPIAPPSVADPTTPVDAPGGAADGYPDLVSTVSGRNEMTIRGFGWPLVGQDAAPYAPIAKRDARAMCLPMLTTAAPDLPASAWRAATGWVDTYPTRATLLSTFQTKDGKHLAYCALPGAFAADGRPDWSSVAGYDDAAVIEACSYLGHLDFGEWAVPARDDIGNAEVAALVSPNGDVARCVLSDDPALRSVQLIDTPISDSPDLRSVIYSGNEDLTVLAGTVGPDVETVQISADNYDSGVATVDGVFALAVPVDAENPSAGSVVRAFDGNGALLDEQTFADAQGGIGMTVANCFTPRQNGNDGC